MTDGSVCHSAELVNLRAVSLLSGSMDFHSSKIALIDSNSKTQNTYHSNPGILRLYMS